MAPLGISEYDRVEDDKMRSFGPYIDEAIPHEAGHILIGWALGLRARGLDVEVVCLPDGGGINLGNFATLGYSPPDEEIPRMDLELKASFMLYIAGGVAGNIFDGLKTKCKGDDADRAELARLTKTSLEELAGQGVGIIQKRRRHFRQLVSLIRQRFTERIWTNSKIQTGRHNLLTQQDLDDLFSKSQPRLKLKKGAIR
jgi:hypothetical protein